MTSDQLIVTGLLSLGFYFWGYWRGVEVGIERQRKRMKHLNIVAEPPSNKEN